MYTLLGWLSEAYIVRIMHIHLACCVRCDKQENGWLRQHALSEVGAREKAEWLAVPFILLANNKKNYLFYYISAG
mgnify:CR=1